MLAIYDTEYQEELKELIRYYSITVLKDGRQCLRKRVEWWTKEDVTYYEETEENIYIRDISRSINPSPHFWQVTSLNGLEQRRTPHSWGRVPFIKAIITHGNRLAQRLGCRRAGLLHFAVGFWGRLCYNSCRSLALHQVRKMRKNPCLF